MSSTKKYIFNPEALSYEVIEVSRRSRIIKYSCLFVVSVALAFFYVWLYTDVLGRELPKTVRLKAENDGWVSKINIINNNLQQYDEALSMLQLRDDEVYRAMFGMPEIAEEIRDAGFGGVNRYSYLEGVAGEEKLKKTMVKLDILTKKSYIQSKSFDEIAVMAADAGEMTSCIPKISPIVPDRSIYRISSSFGNRKDPISGRRAYHKGIDFAMPSGNPIYSTGDGVVAKVHHGRTGYGNYVIIDHGFGYKTRYAHLQTVFVEQGQKVKRGDYIAKSGNSGKSSGPHLHYEVIYMNRQMNPYNYLDLEISPEEYSSMVHHTEAEAEFAMHPSHVKR